MASSAQMDPARLQAALSRASQALLAARGPQSHWTGTLSSSALATATAVTALAIVSRASEISNLKSEISRGLNWLARGVNSDGGWGDADGCLSNLSTTTLCWAAFGAVPGAVEKHRPVVAAAERWLKNELGTLEPRQLAPAILARYGADRTFSVPILTMCALAGRLGSGEEAWRYVRPLPFELAACPHRWWATLRLPVVSYALPALIAIGQARHHHRPSRNPFARTIRKLTRPRTLNILRDIQPGNGGFLEATPLTSFVTMSLAGSGQIHHPVTKRGVEFLCHAQRPDGSWPIDTNLATWVTTLAVEALAGCRWEMGHWQDPIRAWLLAQQNRVEHPYTHAAPGGWAWTDLPGGVPDADDTAGALLALRHLGPLDEPTRRAARAGIHWLMDLQNKDGGIPTFCRGWGTLPFDRSAADLSAHALRAWLAWQDEFPPDARTQLAQERLENYLYRAQRSDGAWTPLWFGNPFVPGEENPTYGTARVLRALQELARHKYSRGVRPENRGSKALARAQANAERWLLGTQKADGSWGGAGEAPSSVEETALAVEALAGQLPANHSDLGAAPALQEAVQKGTAWLIAKVESREWTQPAPIGFYFARLWYYEELYPLIFTVGALGRASRCLS